MSTSTSHTDEHFKRKLESFFQPGSAVAEAYYQLVVAVCRSNHCDNEKTAFVKALSEDPSINNLARFIKRANNLLPGPSQPAETIATKTADRIIESWSHVADQCQSEHPTQWEPPKDMPQVGLASARNRGGIAS